MVNFGMLPEDGRQRFQFCPGIYRPGGLQGEEKRNTFVLGVMAFSSWTGVSFEVAVDRVSLRRPYPRVFTSSE